MKQNKGIKLTKHRAAIAILLTSCAMLSGCGSLFKSRLDSIAAISQPSIGYLDGKYRICRENCPKRTPKELDDSDSLPSSTLLLANKLATINPPQAPQQSIEKHAKKNDQTTDTFTVYFGFGMSKPNRDGQKELDRFVRLASQQSIGLIELTGQTDDIGTQDYNNRLALKRVQFVSRWLKSRGINTTISSSSKGDCCHPAPYNKEELVLKEKRRVSIKAKQNQQ
jgi:outer membrane protein OmpA-like peptidoglycan-associated protein